MSDVLKILFLIPMLGIIWVAFIFLCYSVYKIIKEECYE